MKKLVSWNDLHLVVALIGIAFKDDALFVVGCVCFTIWVAAQYVVRKLG